ncbi:MAG: hypothetical protein Q9M94_02740 [Candidatus Gracilibacteria bacterium]|nr:hypothetical protein [Candidatus Gracilibacteria bacterium]MDQ7023170.1 hypothetical protein [Candidatus Gracilibacteria bacterium]
MLKKIIFFLILSNIFCINNSYANTLIERTINGYKAQIIEYSTNSKFMI